MIWGLLLMLLTQCSSLPQSLTQEGRRTQVFPNGTYYHEISIEPKDRSPRKVSGVVQIRKDRIAVVGLSPFSTTLFRIEEDRTTGKVSAEIFHPSLKQYEEKLREFYASLKLLLLLPLEGEGQQGVKITERGGDKLPREAKSGEITLRLSNYDGNQIPREFEILHPNFRVRVKVTGYED